jgi:hypothetical protein
MWEKGGKQERNESHLARSGWNECEECELSEGEKVYISKHD